MNSSDGDEMGNSSKGKWKRAEVIGIAIAALGLLVAALAFINDMGGLRPNRATEPSAAPQPSTIPSGSSSNGASSGEMLLEAEMRTSLDARVFVACRPNKPAQEGALASINCATAKNGPDLRPIISRFASSETVEQIMDKETGSDRNSNDSCDRGKEGFGLLVIRGETIGRYTCSYQDNGVFRITWSYSKARTMVVAEARDSASLGLWWRLSNVPFRAESTPMNDFATPALD